MKVALSFAAIAFLLITTACSNLNQSATSANNQSNSISALSEQSAVLANQKTESVPGAQPVSSNAPRLEGMATVVLTVNEKPITIEVDGVHAPVTAGNFVDLVQRGVYDGTKFHRVVKSPQPFVAQGGDPQSKDPSIPEGRLGSGNFVDPQTNQDRFIPLEILPKGAKDPVYSKTLKSAKISAAPTLRHRKGAIAMARTPLPDSASAQFYFALANLDFLDGDYAVFGYVTDGMDVVESIQQGDVIESAKVTQGANNLK